MLIEIVHRYSVLFGSLSVFEATGSRSEGGYGVNRRFFSGGEYLIVVSTLY